MEIRDIISIFVVILIFAMLMPVAFNNVFQAFNSTSVPAKPFATTVYSLANLVPLLVVVSLLIGLVYFLIRT
ncbi:MAG: hypothetical protein QXE05_12440 [Nitrososphaeria archaeon]